MLWAKWLKKWIFSFGCLGSFNCSEIKDTPMKTTLSMRSVLVMLKFQNLTMKVYSIITIYIIAIIILIIFFIVHFLYQTKNFLLLNKRMVETSPKMMIE
jgi:hypothetical protein